RDLHRVGVRGARLYNFIIPGTLYYRTKTRRPRLPCKAANPQCAQLYLVRLGDLSCTRVGHRTRYANIRVAVCLSCIASANRYRKWAGFKTGMAPKGL